MVTVTAHRGSSGEAPENTLASLRLAVADGADRAEIDVRRAKDGTLAVVHDENLMRLTGLDRNLSDLTRRELEVLDVGTHFDPRFAGERIPILEEAIQTARGRIRLSLELKTRGGEEGLAASVVDVLRRADATGLCIVTSRDPAVLEDLRALEDDLRLGLVLAEPDEAALAHDVDHYCVRARIATPDLVRRAHRRGREVHVWTVDEPKEMRTMLDRGADGLITNFPRRALRVLGRP